MDCPTHAHKATVGRYARYTLFSKHASFLWRFCFFFGSSHFKPLHLKSGRCRPNRDWEVRTTYLVSKAGSFCWPGLRLQCTVDGWFLRSTYCSYRGRDSTCNLYLPKYIEEMSKRELVSGWRLDWKLVPTCETVRVWRKIRKWTTHVLESIHLHSSSDSRFDSLDKV